MYKYAKNNGLHSALTGSSKLTNINKKIISKNIADENRPVIFSFFSGSGFLDLGFENAGFEVCFVNELHQPFVEAYKFSRKVMSLPEPRFGYFQDSIEEFVRGGKQKCLSDFVKTSKENGLVGFIGGPPCPDFSVGGKNKGSEGENGRLTRTYVECIIKNKPDFFLFENVKGLWRTSKHREFYEEMKSALKNAGYDITDRLTNSIEFGVPQDRDRILMFGINSSVLRKIGNKQLNQDFKWERHAKFNRLEVLNADFWPKRDLFELDTVRKMPNLVRNFECLSVEYWFKQNEVNSHPNSSNYFLPRQALKRFQTIEEGDDSKKSFKRLHRWRYSPTAAYGNNEVHLHPYKERRLSVAEALAIQSLPKEFQLPSTMTLTNMFKTIGNGVPFLLSYGVAMEIYSFLTNEEASQIK